LVPVKHAETIVIFDKVVGHIKISVNHAVVLPVFRDVWLFSARQDSLMSSVPLLDPLRNLRVVFAKLPRCIVKGP
jgi:hypothetical protein